MERSEVAASTEGECYLPSTALFWLSTATTGVVIVLGLWVQSFIVTVNVFQWLKGRTVTATDQIITSIGITRISSIITTPFYFLLIICPLDKCKVCFVFGFFIGVASSFSSIWLSALLSMFFCSKISTIHNVFFSHLKTIISQRAVLLIVACVLLGFAYTLSHFLVISDGLFRNSTYFDLFYNSHIMFPLNVLWNIIPLLIFFLSSFVLVISLGFHVRLMKNHGNVISNADTYVKMIMFTSWSFLSCFFNVMVNLLEWYGMNVMGVMWMCVFYHIFPILHSVLLIYITAKLRNEFLKVVHCGTVCLFPRRRTEVERRDLEETHL